MLQSLLQSSTGYTMNSFYLLGINEHHTFHTHALMVYFKLCSTKNMHNIQICYINIINVSVAIVTTIRVHVGIQNINNIWQSVCYYSAFVGVLYELQYSFNAQISNILRRSSFTPSYLPPPSEIVCVTVLRHSIVLKQKEYSFVRKSNLFSSVKTHASCMLQIFCALSRTGLWDGDFSSQLL